jgi:hypothetical protein
MSEPKKLRCNEGKCSRCSEPGIGCNGNGDILCEDCMFEEVIEEQMPKIVAGETPDREYDPNVAPCDDAEFGMKP